jgi:hypothetical protein
MLSSSALRGCAGERESGLPYQTGLLNSSYEREHMQ